MRSCSRAATAIILIASFHTDAFAQRAIFQSATELVSLNVTVIGQNAKPVTDLSAEQFQVFEDGVQQEVKFFAGGELPVDVVLLLDTSASMTGSMELVQQAATRFARALRHGDRAAVMGISNGLRVIQDFTGDMKAIEAAIRSATPAGKTALYASVYTALTELEKQRRRNDTPRRQAIVVLSDGIDTASTFSFDELLGVVRRYAVPIYTIAPRPTRATRAMREHLYGETTHLADFELRKLTSETGGRSFFPVQLVELEGIYADIANELAQQYAIGYQSSNDGQKSGFRRIVLKILRQGLQWRTRAGYVTDRVTVSRGAAQPQP